MEQWKNILWSDESCYSKSKSDGQAWVWRMPGERHFPECVVPTVKYSGGSAMVLGCFSWYGPCPLVVVQRHMNAEVCLGILDSRVLLTVWHCSGNGQRSSGGTAHLAMGPVLFWGGFRIWMFHDWTGQHRVQCTVKDLNPIEHLWDHLEHRIRNYANR